MRTRTRRTLVLAGAMIAAWTVATFLGSELLRPAVPEIPIGEGAGQQLSISLGWRLARALAGGLTAGLLASFLELKVLPRHARRFGAGTMLVFRSLSYATVAWVSWLSILRLVARQEFGIPVGELFSSTGFQTFLRTPEFGQFILTLVVAGLIINGFHQVSRILGPGNGPQIFFGRYIKPIEEDRLFLFIDLADSTGMAERLGPVGFAELRNDFFHDVAEPVLDTRGQIVQYVGDEVLVTWHKRGKGGAGEPVRCFILLRDTIMDRAEEYSRRYGFVPRFRAGLHGGRVVVSQVGDIKREIGFSGDPINTAARIQGLCRPLGADFLASSDVLRGVTLPARVQAIDLGTHELRGRSAPVHLVSLQESGGEEAITAGLITDNGDR